MREELVDYLQGLADLQYQKRVRINGGSDGTVIHNGVFEKYETELSDTQYVELPEWQSVLAAAKAALVSISERSER